MMLRLIILLLLSLSACSYVGVAQRNVDPRGFGGTDQLSSALNALPSALAAKVQKLRTEGIPVGFSAYSNCGKSAYLCGNLAAVAVNDARKNYLEQSLLSPTRLESLEAALKRIQIEITDSADRTTIEGQVRDAVTVGDRVAVLRSRAAAKSPDELSAMVFHEASHSAGLLDTGTLGEFSPAEAGIDARAAYLVAYIRYVDKTAAEQNSQPPAIVLFRDNFTSPTLASAWALTGNYLLSNGWLVSNPLTYGSVPAVTQRDVSIHSVIDLRTSQYTGSTVHLQARWQTDGRRYVGAIGQSNGDLFATICLGNGSDCTRITERQLYGVSASVPLDARFEVVGSSLKLQINGELVLSTTDTTLPNSGDVGLTLSKAKADLYEVEAR